jgi:hypothetical protein
MGCEMRSAGDQVPVVVRVLTPASVKEPGCMPAAEATRQTSVDGASDGRSTSSRSNDVTDAPTTFSREIVKRMWFTVSKSAHLKHNKQILGRSVAAAGTSVVAIARGSACDSDFVFSSHMLQHEPHETIIAQFSERFIIAEIGGI